MNLEKILQGILGFVILSASVGKINSLQAWIWKSQVKVIYESRTSTWGSPRFFSDTARTQPVPLQKILKGDLNHKFSRSNLKTQNCPTP